MFDSTWEIKQQTDNKKLDFKSSIDNASIESVLFIQWEEHCIECAPPTCYNSCTKYIEREDGRCKRLENGISRNYAHNGLLPYIAECQFEEWGKLESRFYIRNSRTLSIGKLTKIDNMLNNISKSIVFISKLFQFISPKLKLVDFYTLIKRRWIRTKYNSSKIQLDEFVLECYSHELKEYYLHISCVTTSKILYEESIKIQPGYNLKKIAYELFNLSSLKEYETCWIRVSPIGNIRPLLSFSYLHFLKYVKKNNTNSHADKAKCIAWDLDNTLWKGVLIEDGINGIEINKNAIEIIKEMDRRGIIHTIVSKNNYDDAMKALKKYNLEDYFIYPAINWGAKSENLKEIASRINIGLDSIVVIDDSEHERLEISTALKMVRVLSEKEIDNLLDKEYFNIPVTAMGTERRLSYKAEEKRELYKETFNSSYVDFIKKLSIKLNIFHPTLDNDINRCYELIQRSNQLNLTTKRYEFEEFNNLLQSDTVLSYAFSVQDKFGDYGIVGFISVDFSSKPIINNLVISCRIAKKFIEHEVIYNIAKEIEKKDFKILYANLIKTKKNGPLVDVLDEMQFIKQDKGETIEYKLENLNKLKSNKLMTVNKQPYCEYRK